MVDGTGTGGNRRRQKRGKKCQTKKSARLDVKTVHFYGAIEITRIETEYTEVLLKEEQLVTEKSAVLDLYAPIEIVFSETEQTIVLPIQTPPQEQGKEEKKEKEEEKDCDSDSDIDLECVKKLPQGKGELLSVKPCSLEQCKEIARKYFDPSMFDKPLPDGVEDIDAHDADDAQCCSEYIGFIMEKMRQKEVKTMELKRATAAPAEAAAVEGATATVVPCCCKKPYVAESKKPHFTEKQRAILVDWLVDVVVKFKLLSESFFTCVELIDICLQLDDVISLLKELQLIGICCLMISCKAEEPFGGPEVRDFIYICDGAFDRAQIVKGERKILTATKFEVFPATSLFFLRRFSKAAGSSAETHTMAKYICENACVDYNICQSYLPSEIAIGAVVASRAIFELDTLFTKTMQHHAKHDKKRALQASIALMHHLEKNWLPTYTLKAVKRRYSVAKMLEVGRKPLGHALPRLRAEFKQCA